MKKRVFGRQLSRERDTRRALFRSLMRALILNGKIKTTKAKAKAVQGYTEKLITLGKKTDIAARRNLYSILGNDRITADFVVKKVAPALSTKNSGYTRIVNLPRRIGDNAQMVRLEWSLEVEKYVKPGNEKIKDKASGEIKDDKKETKKDIKGRLAGIGKALSKRK